jgi:hypothetical protein
MNQGMGATDEVGEIPANVVTIGHETNQHVRWSLPEPSAPCPILWIPDAQKQLIEFGIGQTRHDEESKLTLPPEEHALVSCRSLVGSIAVDLSTIVGGNRNISSRKDV